MDRLFLKIARNLLVSEVVFRYRKILCNVIAQEITERTNKINNTIWAKVPISVIIWYTVPLNGPGGAAEVMVVGSNNLFYLSG